MDLKEFFKNNPKAALGFSGGVDSAYLLYAAKKYGADIQPYYIKTAFQPEFEYNDATSLAEKIGAGVKVTEYDILSEEIICSNPQNRCYYCKKALFTLLKAQANKDGYTLIIDGTNASDDVGDRPGMKALEELSVRSPLRECGLTKDKIRELSKEAGLFTWKKPAYACLATRIPTGTAIVAKDLKRVENAENMLMSMGFSDFRVRIFHNAARLQVKVEQLQRVSDMRAEILTGLKPYFENVFLDMNTR
ncbi:MAG: ATP-dependent sacrificial sulfur transferase LarE [Hominilimicola sp.]